MAFTPTVNQAPATGADVWVTLITALLTAGWTLPQWSDGVTVHTSSTPTAANLKVLNSWFRLRSPADPNTGQHYEFVVQNGKGSFSFTDWGCKYSASAGFTLFAGSALNSPQASDEVSWSGFDQTAGILGNNSQTGGTGSFTTVFGLDSTYHMHLMVGDSASNYSWYFILITNGGTTLTWSMGMDILTPWAGTSDLAPAMIIGSISGTAWSLVTICGGGTSVANAHMGGVLPTPEGGPRSITWYQAQCVCPGFRAFPVNSWSSAIPVTTPVWFHLYQASTIRAVGLRGWSQLMLSDLAVTARTNMDLFTIAAPGDRIWIQGALLPWPTGVAVVT